jgi:hypothetical protein
VCFDDGPDRHGCDALSRFRPRLDAGPMRDVEYAGPASIAPSDRRTDPACTRSFGEPKYDARMYIDNLMQLVSNGYLARQCCTASIFLGLPALGNFVAGLPLFSQYGIAT